MFIAAKYVLQTSRHDDLQNTCFDPAIEIVELFGHLFLKLSWSKAEGSISYNYRFHIITRFKS